MDFTRLKSYMDRLIKEYNAPGVDCIVYKEHEEVFRYFAGMSDIENNKEMNGEELYLIFSMTKMLTCTAALQLFEQGKFIMNDPVSRFMPEFEKMKLAQNELNVENAAKIASGSSMGEKIENSESGYAQKPITIKDLFTMSGGLNYDLKADGIKQALSEGRTSTRELVGALSQTVLGFEPGSRFCYSLCHDVLGALVEIWSGMSLGKYMEENIFKPLGMKNTFFGVPEDEEKLSRMAARYVYKKDGMTERVPLECCYNLSADYQSGGAGLTSCCEDYALFLDALACGGMGKNGSRILSAKTVELMGTNHLKDKQLEDFGMLRPGYGYGLGVRTHMNPTVSGSLSPVGEFGWDGAAGAFSMVDTKNKLSLTYFQHVHGWQLRIQTEMRNILYSCID